MSIRGEAAFHFNSTTVQLTKLEREATFHFNSTTVQLTKLEQDNEKILEIVGDINEVLKNNVYVYPLINLKQIFTYRQIMSGWMNWSTFRQIFAPSRLRKSKIRHQSWRMEQIRLLSWLGSLTRWEKIFIKKNYNNFYFSISIFRRQMHIMIGMALCTRIETAMWEKFLMV